MDTNYLTPEQVALPNMLGHTLPHLNDILQSFNLPRNIIDSDEEIVCDLLNADERKAEIVVAFQSVNYGKKPERFMRSLL